MSVRPSQMPILTTTRARTRLMLVLAVLAIAAGVWGVAQLQIRTADEAFDEAAAAEQMLVSMLDQETALRGYALTGRERYLAPMERGTREFDQAADRAVELLDSDDATRLARQLDVARNWQAQARDTVDVLRRFPEQDYDLERAEARKAIFDSFRNLNAELQTSLAAARADERGRAGLLSVTVILALALLFGGVGMVWIERSARAARDRRAHERDYRETQAEFTGTMQVMRDEREAYELVRHHLERTIAGAEVLVLNRNNSDDRLLAAGGDIESSPLAGAMADARPDSCLSIRLGRDYVSGEGAEPLLSCELCGRLAGELTCVPSLVSGEVIGSVLVRNDHRLADEDRRRVQETVAQAAPVLANLRNLAIAETRAATDALTRLPNSRSCRDTIKRMLAHSARTHSPLACLLLDLDHFKQINDRFGHGAGDDVLAVTGEVLRASVRTSDFAGRYGGEEFMVLLPDTDAQGALETAGKLRRAIAGIEVAEVPRKISASLGVAVHPADAGDADSLMRMADRALYFAKSNGRDRVEMAQTAAHPGEGPVAGTVATLG